MLTVAEAEVETAAAAAAAAAAGAAKAAEETAPLCITAHACRPGWGADALTLQPMNVARVICMIVG